MSSTVTNNSGGSGSGSGSGSGTGHAAMLSQLSSPCPICLLPYEQPALTSCGHVFCFGCLNQLVIRSASYPRCPLCRKNL